MDYTNDILGILSSELEPYVSHGGEACIDGVLTSAQKLNEFLRQKLQKTTCSTLLPSVQEMIDVIEAEKVKYPRMWTADVLRLLNRVKELAAIA